MFKRHYYIFILTPFLILSLMAQNLSANEVSLGPVREYFKIDAVRVVGLKKVEQEAILEKIESKKGMILDNYTLKRDIEKIYSLKFFEKIEARSQVKAGKNHLVFFVEEKPIISSVTLTGNDELDDDELKEQMKVKTFNILDVNTIKSDVKALQKFYEEKGFYLASVNFELKRIDKENVEVVYNIQEFDKVRVKKIIFLGNRSFVDTELKAIMETREESLFSWMTNAGNFKEFNFQTDIERIKYFYKSKGHLQINVGKPEVTVSEDKKWIFITIPIQEGPKFQVNEIYFDGELLFSDEELREKIALKEGDDYSEDKLRQDIQFLTELYQDKGYAFANVLRTLNVVPGETKVDVQFSFEKGKVAYFGKITVRGNTKTRDKVVRRELKIREGMRFSGTSLRRSKENVNRLGFFEPASVIFNTVSPKGKDDVLDVEISVKERNTGQISLGAGYSTTTKGFIQASIAQNNFRGLGQTISFSLNIADQTKTYNVGFTEPYFMDTQWTAGGDIFSTEDTLSRAYAIERKGFDIRLGHPIFEYTRLFATYKFVDTELTQVEDQRINPDLENGLASSIETSLVHDKRNNKFEPTKGNYQSFSLEYAGIGGDKKWFQASLDSRHYFNVFGDLVFRVRNSASKLFRVNSQPIPRSEMYFLGGSRNLRGYGYETIGPITSFIDENDENDPSDDREVFFNERGFFSFFTNLEFEHPLVKEAGLKWVAFFDAGNVWRRYPGQTEEEGYDLRYNYGFGFRWFSPIGVLRFEFGYPINPRDDDASKQFHFDIGQLF